MPHPLLIFSQSDYLIQVVDKNSHSKWQTVQIQISWLLQKPTDLDLYCLQRQGISRFSRIRDNYLKMCLKYAGCMTWQAVLVQISLLLQISNLNLHCLFRHVCLNIKINMASKKFCFTVHLIQLDHFFVFFFFLKKLEKWSKYTNTSPLVLLVSYMFLVKPNPGLWSWGSGGMVYLWRDLKLKPLPTVKS